MSEEQTKKPMVQKLAGKITVKQIVGAIKTLPVEITNGDGEKVTVLRAQAGLLYRIAGVVRETKKKSTNYGDCFEFIGKFRAIRLSDGVVTDAPSAYLPRIAESYLAELYNEQSQVDGFSGLEVGFDIGVAPANNAHGYQFEVRPLIQRQQADFLDALIGTLPPVALLGNDAPTAENDGEDKTEKPGKSTAK